MEPLAAQEALFEAASNGSLTPQLLQSLIRQGADPNRRSEDNHRAMNYACAQGHLEAAKLLLETVNFNWNNFLIDAVCSGSTDITRLLIEKGGNPNYVDVSGGDRWSLLHLAVLNDDAAMCELLVSMGADIEAAHLDCMSPLSLAHSSRHIAANNAAKKLIGLGAEHVEGGVYGKRSETFEEALNKGTLTASHIRALQRNYEPVPIVLPVSSGKTDAVKLIADLAYGGNLGNFHTPLLQHAACSLNPSTVEALLERGVSINQLNENNLSAISSVILLRNPRSRYITLEKKDRAIAAMARFLIDKGIDTTAPELNIPATPSRSKPEHPLIYAAYKGLPETAITLIKAGFDPGALDSEGRNILGITCAAVKPSASRLSNELQPWDEYKQSRFVTSLQAFITEELETVGLTPDRLFTPAGEASTAVRLACISDQLNLIFAPPHLISTATSRLAEQALNALPPHYHQTYTHQIAQCKDSIAAWRVTHIRNTAAAARDARPSHLSRYLSGNNGTDPGFPGKRS